MCDMRAKGARRDFANRKAYSETQKMQDERSLLEAASSAWEETLEMLNISNYDWQSQARGGKDREG